jgi:hypothetical protein
MQNTHANPTSAPMVAAPITESPNRLHRDHDRLPGCCSLCKRARLLFAKGMTRYKTIVTDVMCGSDEDYC